MLTILLAITLLAQGSGSTAPSSGAEPPSLDQSPFIVTKSVDATITEITPNVIVVREVNRKGKERIYEFRLEKKMSLSADKKTELGASKKKLTLQDLQAGMYVRITWRDGDLTVLALRVLPLEAKKAA